VGTEKRARQKANRAQRQQEMVKAESRRRGMRIAGIVIGLVVLVFGLVWIATKVTGNNDSTSSGTTVAGTTVAGGSAVTPTCPPAGGVDTPVRTFSAPPPTCIDPSAKYQAVVTTNKGVYTIDLDATAAPIAVNNFVFLAENGYYDDTPCHRIIPGFVVQCGDPTGSGTGGPGYQFKDELPAKGAYKLGSVAMANSGPDTNGSQFFVITGDQGVALPPSYTLFGQVTDGFDSTVAKMAAAGTSGGTPSEPIKIQSVKIVTS
jgi:peptidyl-prolyl cis-trans isomerase B (cyclophilin B)